MAPEFFPPPTLNKMGVHLNVFSPQCKLCLARGITASSKLRRIITEVFEQAHSYLPKVLGHLKTNLPHYENEQTRTSAILCTRLWSFSQAQKSQFNIDGAQYFFFFSLSNTFTFSFIAVQGH